MGGRSDAIDRLAAECRALGMALGNLQLRMREDGVEESIFESAVFTADVRRLASACASWLDGYAIAYPTVDSVNFVRENSDRG